MPEQATVSTNESNKPEQSEIVKTPYSEKSEDAVKSTNNTCNICNKSFKTLAALKTHNYHKHKYENTTKKLSPEKAIVQENSSENKSEQSENKINNPEKSENSIDTNITDITTVTTSAKSKDTESNNPDESEIVKTPYSEKSEDGEKSISKTYECIHCEKSFDFNNLLIQHLKNDRCDVSKVQANNTETEITENEITENEITETEITEYEVTENENTEYEVTENEIIENGTTENEIIDNEITENEINNTEESQNFNDTITDITTVNLKDNFNSERHNRGNNNKKKHEKIRLDDSPKIIQKPFIRKRPKLNLSMEDLEQDQDMEVDEDYKPESVKNSKRKNEKENKPGKASVSTNEINCNICNKSFSNPFSLKRHNSALHKSEQNGVTPKKPPNSKERQKTPKGMD